MWFLYIEDFLFTLLDIKKTNICGYDYSRTLLKVQLLAITYCNPITSMNVLERVWLLSCQVSEANVEWASENREGEGERRWRARVGLFAQYLSPIGHLIEAILMFFSDTTKIPSIKRKTTSQSKETTVGEEHTLTCIICAPVPPAPLHAWVETIIQHYCGIYIWFIILCLSVWLLPCCTGVIIFTNNNIC